MNNINIFLIRHAESTANAATTDQIGQDNNTQLTTNGVNQAGRLGGRFLKQGISFDEIWSSTFLRAKTTADIFRKIVRYEPELSLTDAICEYNPGSWRGRERSEIYDNPDNMKDIIYKGMGFLFPAGESYHQVSRRAATFIEQHIIYSKDILDLAEKKDVNIALFSHGITIKTALFYVMNFDSSFMWKIKIDNTSVSHLIFNDRGWFLNSINDIGHLL